MNTNMAAGIGNNITLNPTAFHQRGVFGQLSATVDNGMDAAFAFNIDWHVIQAYRYLIDNYRTGDRVYLFGFSRGSFVARILAGMIEKIGLLDSGLDSMVLTAWEIYSTWEQEGQPSDELDPAKCRFSVRNFKQTFCRDNVVVEFMGLFDSVNSCGWVRDRLFPYTSNTMHVNHIRHAVAIHERRAKFKQNLFKPFSYLPTLLYREVPMIFTPVDEDVALESVSRGAGDMMEMWFPGDHSDVGGNWRADAKGDALSDLSLRWILAAAVELGVHFKIGAIEEYLDKYTPLAGALAFQHDVLSFKRCKAPLLTNPYCLEGTSLFPERTEWRAPPSVEGGNLDANGGHGSDSVLSTLLWWIIEVMPVGYLVENRYGRWRNIYWPNLGSSRTVPETAQVHWSVMWRMKFVRGFTVENLPEEYVEFGSIVQSEDGSGDVIIALEDVVNTHSGLLKGEGVRAVVNKARRCKVGFAIDWLNPPDELAFVCTKR